MCFSNQHLYSCDRGIGKGIAQGRAEVARNLLMFGVEIDKISESTGLGVEEIKEQEHNS